MSRTTLRAVELAVLAAIAGILLALTSSPAAADSDPARAASGWSVRKFPHPKPTCDAGVAAPEQSPYFDKRFDCGFGRVNVSGTRPSSLQVEFVAPDGTVLATVPATFAGGTLNSDFTYDIVPGDDWPSGKITLRAVADGEPATGTSAMYLNGLGATLAALPNPKGYRPGQSIPVSGRVYELDTTGTGVTIETGVPATFELAVRRPDGSARTFGPFTADDEGNVSATLPASATEGLTATKLTNFETVVGIELADASYTDAVTGEWAADGWNAGTVTIAAPAEKLTLENTFVSASGWVKPGEAYPFRVFVKNYTDRDASAAKVTVPAAVGMRFLSATPIGPNGGSASATASKITWTVGYVPARTDTGPGVRTLVVQARSKTLTEDPKIVWKDVSTVATLTYTGGGQSFTSKSEGPKVIPPDPVYDTARYGFRPFPVVPVDYFERKHDTAHSSRRLAEIINSEQVEGSTVNLYHEMSYGQLTPNGTVPSAGIASADWTPRFSGRYAGQDYQFTSLDPQGTCRGATLKDAHGVRGVYDERISDGWYQLPGTTEYYGSDRVGPLAVPGAPIVGDIDAGCGPTGKLVYDAAHIADAEIDYSDYDTDKDGVVDFFMVVFAGLGGNGASQTGGGYDNVWPHSSTLEAYYVDPETGLTGYISDDQLRDHQGRVLFYVDGTYTRMTSQETQFPVYVRVGAYNVNPEDAIEHASVISHEYGHSLGLPDFYTASSSRTTYGDWNLMATDKSQHMDVFSKQELGWIVPRVLKPGATTASGFRDSKADTHRIDWVQQNGQAYTLSGPSVHNGEAYAAALRHKRIIDPEQVPSGTHVWWSGSGDGFGCPPVGGHNLDVALVDLEDVPAGTPVTLTLKSLWSIEWDYDYGFVMVSDDSGGSYTALPSTKGYTTPREVNPTANACQSKFGNGITGSSGSYAGAVPTATVDRAAGEYPAPVFLDDEYDLSAYAGSPIVLRFAYATDPGVAKPAWFIDDVKVTADGEVLYESDFESGDEEPRIHNGGCKDGLQTARVCTPGWMYVDASQLSSFDHAYYLEMRDRSGFDESGKGQNDRDPINFEPGLLLVYTNEAHGYGNFSTADPPAQSPLDSVPAPGDNTPNLNDAAFTGAPARSSFSDSITAERPGGWVDNYVDPDSTYGDDQWHFDFGCLTFQVLSMAGDGIGPATAPGDLVGNVRFTIGTGCGTFDYGYTSSLKNEAPTAVAQAKPTVVDLGQKVTFDGSASFDDRQTAAKLAYLWDFDGDGKVDKTAMSISHKYPQRGTYSAKLQVRDADGAVSAADVLTVTVR